MNYTDYLVKTNDLEALKEAFQKLSLQAYVLGLGTTMGVVRIDGYPVVRVFGLATLFESDMKDKKYCEIIRKLEKK